MSDILDAALQYAGRNWPVLPLNGKIPAIKKWPKKASTDPAQLEKWFAHGNKNLGIVTGNGLAVVDLDSLEGLTLFRSICGEPHTLMARSGRGVHLYYSVDGPAPSNSGQGLDIRGDGGLVVAPPSLHASGRRYAWIDPLAVVAPIPPELLAWFRNRPGGAGKQQKTSGEQLPEYLIRSVRGRIADRAGEGCFEDKTLTAEDLMALADAIPNPPELGHDSWKEVGMAFSLDSGGSDAAREAFFAFSRKNVKKFDEDFTLKTWEHIQKYPPDRLHFGTLIFRAQQAVPGFELPSRRATVTVSATVVNGAPVALPASFTITFPDHDARNHPKATAVNAYVAIKALGVVCRKDVFHERLLIGGHVRQELTGDLSDATIQILRRIIYETFRFDPGLQNTDHAAVQLCLENQYDPVVSYIDGLVWDRVPRLQSWLSVYLGAEASVLNEHMGKLILCAAVRRARHPGAKFDQIVVLEGPEGTKKSGAIEVMAGEENFSDQDILTLDGRGQQEAVQGIWLYEIADLSGIARADVDKVKAFASRKVDRARPAYGRYRVDSPRRCIFFATTNDATYLKSLTGNRRFWPIACGKIDLEALARDRGQLWAEAAHIEKTLPHLFLAEAFWKEARALQESRREEDPLEDCLAELVGTVVPENPDEYRITTATLWGNLQGISKSSANAKRVRYLMQKLGWKYAENGLKIAGKMCRGYFRPK